MSDYMIRAMAAGEQLRAFAITSKYLVEEARKSHETMPIATAALGRTMSAALMMGYMLKGEEDLLTVQIEGDGPIRGIVATADSKGNVKGYVYNPYVLLPAKEDGHLNVGGAVGKGTLTVIRDLDLKNTYTGQVELQSGEIAEDITRYFAESEQTPSSVGLGVLVNEDASVRCAGGFIVQVMPSAAEETIARLEENVKGIPYVTDMQREGATPETMLARILDGFDVEITEKKPVRFYCNCDRDRTDRALLLLGEEELSVIGKQTEGTDLTCQFCGEKYHYEPADIEKLRRELQAQKRHIRIIDNM